MRFILLLATLMILPATLAAQESGRLTRGSLISSLVRSGTVPPGPVRADAVHSIVREVPPNPCGGACPAPIGH